MGILNQYSYVLFVILAGIGLGTLLWRWQRPPLVLRVLLLVVFVIVAAGLSLSRRYPAPEVTTLADAETILSNEQPTFVMLYSNY